MCPSLVNPNNKDVAGNQEHQFKNKLDNFGLFFLAMDKCCDADDKMQLFIFVCGITKEFEIMDELNAFNERNHSKGLICSWS